MSVKLILSVRNAMAQSIVDAIDAEGASGSVKLYDGAQPTGPATAITTQSLLGELALSFPCGTPTNGVLVFAAIADDDQANASGTASWARFYDALGNAVCDASISVVGGGGDLQMNTVNVIINGPLRFTSLQWTMPGG